MKPTVVSSEAPAADTRSTWSRDFLASVVVFLVALPLCMGISIASGMPPTAGIITGIIGGIVVGFLAGSPLQVSGPAAGLSVLVLQFVQEQGAEMLGVVVLFAGLLQLAAGLFKLGQWFRAVSPAVIYGMLAGIGVLILASQFHVMLDYKPVGTGIQNLLGIPGALINAISAGDDHLKAGRVGLLTIVTIMLWELVAPKSLAHHPGAAGRRARRHARRGGFPAERHQIHRGAEQYLVGDGISDARKADARCSSPRS